MPPVGNDVVDLEDPENVGKSLDRRFCRRVFNDQELALIAVSAKPDTILWALWAAKEAAYKVISRSDPSVCSIPKKYPVVLETSTYLNASPSMQGTVNTPRGDVLVRIQVTDSFLHALAAETLEELTGIVARVESVAERTDDPADFTRKILLKEIAGRLDCPVDELAILKERVRPWAPYVMRLSVRIPAMISMSHDGRYAAFACSTV